MSLPLISNLLLISFWLNVYGYRMSSDQHQTTPIATIPITTTSPKPHKCCHYPNQTRVDHCNCWPTCDGMEICATCTAEQLPTCECSKGYVLYDYSLERCVLPEDCPSCKGPYEEFRHCSTCEGTCADPFPKCSADGCGPPACQCKKGYVRDKNGACIPPYKCFTECEFPTFAPPTTSTGINCYYGVARLSNCLMVNNRTKCSEIQKEEAKNFIEVYCGLDTQCYTIRHNCYSADYELLHKGCATNPDQLGKIAGNLCADSCESLKRQACRNADSDSYECNLCQGDFCNRLDDIILR